MDTLEPIADPRAESRDIVNDVLACAGYRPRLWIAPFVWTTTAVVSAGLMTWVLLNLWVALATWLLGAVSLFWVLQISNDWDEHTVSLRNALERRLGLPEARRHRDTYPGWFCDS